MGHTNRDFTQGNTVIVSYSNANGEWRAFDKVHYENRYFKYKKDAVQWASARARSLKPAKLYIQRQDGSLLTTRTYK